jgi:class 3 adenylate cyclase
VRGSSAACCVGANGRRPGSLPEIRAGINIGEVIEGDDGDVFGLAVDAAEHIQAKAKAGEVLVSELVRGVVGSAAHLQFEERGRFRLKNFPGRWRLYAVPWQPHQPAKQAMTCSLVVCDFASSVQMFERLGDDAALDVLRDYNAIVRANLDLHPPWASQVAGDTTLAAFQSLTAALECAVDMQKAFEAHNQEHSGEPLRVRIGLHVGEVILEADSLFGRAVHFAFRLSSVAEGGEILASAHVKDLMEPDAGVTFGIERNVELRGLDGKYSAYEVRWR